MGIKDKLANCPLRTEDSNDPHRYIAYPVGTNPSSILNIPYIRNNRAEFARKMMTEHISETFPGLTEEQITFDTKIFNCTVYVAAFSKCLVCNWRDQGLNKADMEGAPTYP